MLTDPRAIATFLKCLDAYYKPIEDVFGVDAALSYICDELHTHYPRITTETEYPYKLKTIKLFAIDCYYEIARKSAINVLFVKE